MKGIRFTCKYDPKPEYRLTDYELNTKKIWDSSSVWRYPKLEMVELDKPKPGPNEVLIKVKACGICGSDLHFWESDEQGYTLYPGHARFESLILGHEISGIIEEVGSGVVDFKPGSVNHLTSGSQQTVDVSVIPSRDTGRGKYHLAFLAEANETRTAISTVLIVENTASYWLWIGIGIVCIVIIGFIFVYLRFGK